MPSTPTTKSQVQAYRFVLRRMESALVRKDAVMLHDPMGTHKRAVVAGAFVAILGVLGFLVWGLISKPGSVQGPGSIVIGKESGSVYAVMGDPGPQKKRLIPVWNIASAKLLVMAQQAQGAQSSNKDNEPTMVSDEELAKFPRGPLTGMPGAPESLPPADGQRAPASWAVCDRTLGQQGASETMLNKSAVETTAIGGQQLGNSAPGQQSLGKKESLYVQDSNGQRYLVYRVGAVQGPGPQPGTRVVRAKVDPGDTGVGKMFHLNDQEPRKISANVLNAIPEVAPLKKPEISSPDKDATYLPGHKVGDVARVDSASGGPEYYILLQHGIQRIPPVAADLVSTTVAQSEQSAVSQSQIAGAPQAPEGEQLDLWNLPGGKDVVPAPTSGNETMCLNWSQQGGNQMITMTTGPNVPSQQQPVRLAHADGPGPGLDYFFMPPGQTAVVRGTRTEDGAPYGPMYLVSDRGVRYGVKDRQVAGGLGVLPEGQDASPAPASIVNLLPTGAFLDPAQSTFVYDAPQNSGVPSQLPKPQQAAGS